MGKRYRNLDYAICQRAVATCFDGKWDRMDVLSFVECYAGIAREEIYRDALIGAVNRRNEAVDCIALARLDMAEGILAGQAPDDMEPVRIKSRVDGLSGKVRDIASLCIWHQLLGHLEVLLLEPLFRARLLPTQHSSIPGRGQTKLMRQCVRILHKDLGIKVVGKLDGVSAYASLQYSVVAEIVRREVPRAKEAICILVYLATLAPGGHMIIGGYLDAWLFNFAMSYLMRYLLSLRKVRRGKEIPLVIRCVSYADDVGLFFSNKSAAERVAKLADRWAREHLGMALRVSACPLKLCTAEEEQARKRAERPAQRGSPCLDMAGFRIHKSYVTVRKRVFLRARRRLLRGWRELRRYGTLLLSRAQSIISYNGFIANTTSRKFAEKYHVQKLLQVAKQVQTAALRRREEKRRIRYYAAVMRYEQCLTVQGDAGGAA